MKQSLLSYPRVCGLLGKNPSRLSQAMHNAAFSARGLPFIYAAFNTEDTAFGLQAMRTLGFRGLSLTIPHKEAAMTLVDECSVEATTIGAINTVVNNDGELLGSNTDYVGIREALREVGFAPDKRPVLLFGAGGASRAALYALKELGIKNILLTNRTSDRASALASEFSVQQIAYEDLAKFDFSSLSLFINSSAIGSPSAPSNAEYPFALNSFGSGQFVFDMVTRETLLLQAAKDNGATIVPGLRMLLHQAVPQFLAFTGETTAPIAEMEHALLSQSLR